VEQGGLRSLALVGRWRPEYLADQWPGLVGDESAWPEHLPHHVLVHVGANDLFPTRIEYRGADERALAEAPEGRLPSRRPLASYEFDDIQFAAPMPERHFEGLAQSDWRDVTARAMERLRKPPPLEPAKVAEQEGLTR
jgi:hypothetical protein